MSMNGMILHILLKSRREIMLTYRQKDRIILGVTRVGNKNPLPPTAHNLQMFLFMITMF